LETTTMLDLLRRIHEKHNIVIALWPGPDGKWFARATVSRPGKADEPVKNWTSPAHADEQAFRSVDAAFVDAINHRFDEVAP
jgi:hypothetical protein